MLFWHVPAPNEALLISGSKRQSQDTQFRIVTGHGSFVLPIKQKARILSLALREAEIVEECITIQGIRLNVRAVAVFKVGDDPASIANAARRFLAEQNRVEELVGRVFAGHLRSIIGGLTVEEIIRERDRVAQEIKDGSHAEMEKLGIVVDALQIQEIEDATGYINNLAAPHAAAVASQARIAQAKADQEAAQREQEAQALKAEYERDVAIKTAGFMAETEHAKAQAAQAGPLAAAKASQDVIAEQTKLAQRQAELAAQRLEAEVRRPADAEAYRQRTLAEAQRDQAKFAADGAAYTERTTAEAQADANKARAASLREGNQELIAASRIIENLPVLVQAAARGLSGSNLTILNGTEGVNEVLVGLVGQGMSILDALKKSTVNPAAAAGNGSTVQSSSRPSQPAPVPVVPAVPAKS
jgi:flotillin